ncbi:MAG: hypothetical protein ABWJ99_04685 [Caldimicrobium sp.]
MRCKFSLCSIIAFFILGLTLFYGLSSGRGFYPSTELKVKRGYLLDRKGEPLVINKENFKAYLILKGESPLGRDWPKEIQLYLKNPLEIPKKGLFLLSERLTLEEVKKLEKIENVVIKGDLERKPLFEGLKPLIGEVSGGEGISGLEKVFDPVLKKGESVITSLDSKFLKRVYYLNKNYGEFFLKGIAQFRISTGELIAYYSQGEKDWLERQLLLGKDYLGVRDKVVWELDNSKNIERPSSSGITPLYLIKAYLTEACGKPIYPTLLPKDKELCSPSEKEIEFFYYLKDSEEWIYLTKKDDFLYVFLGGLSVNEEEYSFERLKNNLQYLVKKL